MDQQAVLDVLQRDLQQLADVIVGQPVMHHPPVPSSLDDPVRPQQPQRVRSARLAQAGEFSQPADARFVVEQHDQHAQATRIGEQPEDVRDVGQTSSPTSDDLLIRSG